MEFVDCYASNLPLKRYNICFLDRSCIDYHGINVFFIPLLRSIVYYWVINSRFSCDVIKLKITFPLRF